MEKYFVNYCINVEGLYYKPLSWVTSVSGRQSLLTAENSITAYNTISMELGSRHCTGDRDQDHPHGKEMQKSKMAVWGGLTNSCQKKRSEKQRRKGKI